MRYPTLAPDWAAERFTVRSSFSSGCNEAFPSEVVERMLERTPSHGEWAAPCDVVGKSWIDQGEPRSQDAPVGLCEKDCDTTTEGCELISVGLQDLPNQSLAFQTEVVVSLSRRALGGGVSSER